MTARTHQTRKQSRQKASKPDSKQGAQPRVEAPVEQTVQRVHAMPPALLRADEVMKLQGVLGNHATQQMLKPSLTPSAGNAIQRDYVGELIHYGTIDNEKTQGEIKTGAKLTATLTKRVQTFNTALASGNQVTIRKALVSIMERLNKDSAKKLKKPKRITVIAQQQAAIAFFNKWKRITQEHIDFLDDKGGTAVTDFQQAYGVTPSKKKGKEIRILDDDSTTSSSSDDRIEITPSKSKQVAFNFDMPPWDMATQAEVKSSGKGGAVIVSFPGGGKIAVKRNSPQEVLGARMAQESGLTMPRTRLAVGVENDAIDDALIRLGAGKLASPYTVVEYVPGESVTETFKGKGKVNKQQVMALAASMGRWFAFNIITGDNDNFNRLVTKGSPMGGVNTGNYLVSSESPNEVTAIDQTVMGGKTQEGQGLQNSQAAIEAIMEGDGLFALNIANDIYAALGNPPGFDGDSLIPVIMKAAKEQIQQSSRILSRDKILELAGDLDVNKLGEVIDRVEWIAAQVG